MGEKDTIKIGTISDNVIRFAETIKRIDNSNYIKYCKANIGKTANFTFHVDNIQKKSGVSSSYPTETEYGGVLLILRMLLTQTRDKINVNQINECIQSESVYSEIKDKFNNEVKKFNQWFENEPKGGFIMGGYTNKEVYETLLYGY